MQPVRKFSALSMFHGLRGKLVANEVLAPYTTLKIGGAADMFFQPADEADCLAFLEQLPADMPLTLLGAGSNTLVRDGGIRGCVLYLSKGCDGVTVDGVRITAQAGASCGKVARAAREASLTGLEFFCGIPGSVGGAVFMNAGAYGRETFQTLQTVKLWQQGRGIVTLEAADLQHGYRTGGIELGWVVLEAAFQLEVGKKEAIREQMRRINKERSTSQPLNMPSSGSWFRNFDAGKAWQLVEKVGGRGLQIGGAMVSEKHANFFVNTGGATAADMEALSDEVARRVKEECGVVLHREVRVVGK